MREANIKTGNSQLPKDGIVGAASMHFLPNRFLRKLFVYFLCIRKPTTEAERRNEHVRFVPVPTRFTLMDATIFIPVLF